MLKRTELFQIIFRFVTSNDKDAVKQLRRLASNEGGLFTIAQAAYYYSTLNHTGMVSYLYRWSNMLGYRPSHSETYEGLVESDYDFERAYELIGQLTLTN